MGDSKVVTSATSGDTTVAAAPSRSARKRRLLINIISYFFIITFGLFFAFPLLWTFSSSLQTWQELRSIELHLLPSVPQWRNYRAIFENLPFARWMLNSFIIVAISVPGQVLTSTMVAYGFARFPFKGRDVLFVLMLATMMIPMQVTLIPQFVLFYHLGLVNTYVPLTIGSWLGGGAFSVFLMRQFVRSIPRDLDEAALIDGADPFRILFQIIMPLLKPALTTVGLLGFLGQWNSFFIPFIYLSKMKLYTAAVGLRFFNVQSKMAREPRDHLLQAAAAILTLPVLVAFIAAQRYFVSGIVMTGLKV